MSDAIRSEIREGVAHVSFNAPPANALSSAFVLSLDRLLDELGSDDDVRAVVFTSRLEKIFMAGADLKELLEVKKERSHAYFSTGQQVLNKLERLPKPTIACISGHAMGGGCEFTLCCDFRYMSETRARIGLPEVNLGLLPGAGGTQRLPRLIGRSKAVGLLLRGQTLTGPEALAIGLVDAVFPPERLAAETTALAEELARGATRAMAEIKACLSLPLEEALSKGLARELEGIKYLFNETQDAREGIRAFNEKRKPEYRGR